MDLGLLTTARRKERLEIVATVDPARLRLAQGQRLLEEALLHDPTNISVLNYLGVVEYDNDHLGKAAEYWKKSLGLNPAQPDLPVML